MTVENRFAQFIREQALFTETDRVLLAVSGGKDSVLMARLFAGIGQTFGIAHCNFQLRGKESDADEALVSQLAFELNVPLYTEHFDTQRFARENHVSIEMAARTLRYTWFEEIRSQHGYEYIALAHHQNDTVETMLLNLVRGTGIAGLQGILPKRNRLIRPLLFLDREEIDQIVERYGLSFRDDASNFSTTYMRNKIRLEVIPKLKEINPALEQTFVENAKRFEELNDFLKNYTDQLRKQWFTPFGTGSYQIEIKPLQEMQPLDTLLYELFRPYGFTAAVLGDLVRTWSRSDRSGKVFYSPSYQLAINREQLILTKITKASTIEPVLLFPGDRHTFGDYQVSASAIENIPHRGYVPGAKANRVCLDADCLGFPLQIRTWQKGDRFQPLGMKTKKKLSDFFVSLKLANKDKTTVPLFLDSQGNIVWVSPFRIGERYKITDKTKKVVTLECVITYGR